MLDQIEELTELEPSYFTYRRLRDVLNKLSDEQLEQPVQFSTPASYDMKSDTYALGSLICIGRIRDLYECPDGTCDVTRSSVDNGHHPDHIVMLTDDCMFSSEGNAFYEMTPAGQLIGDKDGLDHSDD